MCRHAVDHRTHAKLAYTEEDVAADWIYVEAGRVLEDGLGRCREVSRTAKQLRDDALDGIHHYLTCVTGCDGFVCGEDMDLLLPAVFELRCEGAFELRRGRRISLLVLLELF